MITGYGSNSWWKYGITDESQMRAAPSYTLLNNSDVQYYSNGNSWTSSTVAVTSRGIWPERQSLVYGTSDTGNNGKLVRKTTAGNVLLVKDAEL